MESSSARPARLSFYWDTCCTLNPLCFPGDEPEVIEGLPVLERIHGQVSYPLQDLGFSKGNKTTVAADSFKLLFLSNWPLGLINF